MSRLTTPIWLALQMAFLCANVVVQQQWKSSVRIPLEMKTSWREVYKRVDFLEDHNGTPRLKRTHRYHTQVQAQMWVCGVNHSFFVVWTAGHRALYEQIQFDKAYTTKVINNLTLFYKAYTLPCMLGYRDIFQCSKCEKVILEEAEINNAATENSISCDACSTWWHLPCAGLTEHCIKSLDSLLCFSCLVDNADSHDDGSSSDDDECSVVEQWCLDVT